MKSICRTWKNGHKSWLSPKGVLHREDGPAIEYPDGLKHWYLNNRYYTKKEFDYLTQDKESATI